VLTLKSLNKFGSFSQLLIGEFKRALLCSKKPLTWSKTDRTLFRSISSNELEKIPETFGSDYNTQGMLDSINSEQVALQLKVKDNADQLRVRDNIEQLIVENSPDHLIKKVSYAERTEKLSSYKTRERVDTMKLTPKDKGKSVMTRSIQDITFSTEMVALDFEPNRQEETFLQLIGLDKFVTRVT
jgi:hypothetical protein